MNELTDLRNAMTHFILEKIWKSTVTESKSDSCFDGSQFGTGMLLARFKENLMS